MARQLLDRSAPLDRFNGFSDGVLAIVITLLAFDLPDPEPGVPLATTLSEQWPTFLGYLISFAFIGGVWMEHARLTRLMRTADTVVYGLNLVMLLFVGLLPFSTRVMVNRLTGPDVELSVLFYGVVVLMATITLTLLMLYVAREESLLTDDVADDKLRRIGRQRWVSIGVNAFSLVVAFFSPLAAIVLYLIQTLLLLAYPLIGMRRRGLPSSSKRHDDTAAN